MKNLKTIIVLFLGIILLSFQEAKNPKTTFDVKEVSSSTSVNKVFVIYANWVSESQKQSIRESYIEVFGVFQVQSCSNNPQAEIWHFTPQPPPDTFDADPVVDVEEGITFYYNRVPGITICK
ncbi:hypothetical protein AAON49_05725 [Pseudotenacibaculum sp. MALMAid0570]|uniref:hypothetical protein n=1 Tax=Pseudotenacibaculum sp. MALMAid0570 TaxID=3143938 RepID=UPI0032DE3975